MEKLASYKQKNSKQNKKSSKNLYNVHGKQLKTTPSLFPINVFILFLVQVICFIHQVVT